MKTTASSKDDYRQAPIGVFDSGVGGISVLKHIHAALPGEHLIYCADSHHAPYGSKTPQAIRQRARLLTDFLLSRGAKALVIACNTATAAAAAMLRENYAVPIVGMEPAVKPAAAATRTGVVGVLATSGTLASAQFAALLENYGRDIRVVTQACHGLVECIERGELESDVTRDLLARYLTPLLEAGADTIVLGCTHYPFVKPLIEALAGPDVTLIDTGAAVARQLHKRLQAAGLLSGATTGGVVGFWTNGEAPLAMEVMTRLWGEGAEVGALPGF